MRSIAKDLGYKSLQDALRDSKYTHHEMMELLDLAAKEKLEYLWQHKFEGESVYTCPHCLVASNYPFWNRKEYGCRNCGLGAE